MQYFHDKIFKQQFVKFSSNNYLIRHNIKYSSSEILLLGRLIN